MQYQFTRQQPNSATSKLTLRVTLCEFANSTT
jgi:hypothetical protein